MKDGAAFKEFEASGWGAKAATYGPLLGNAGMEGARVESVRLTLPVAVKLAAGRKP